MLDWSGVSKKNQLVYGATAGFTFLTAVEIMDGFSEEWGGALEQAFLAYCKVNKWILRKDIKRRVGKVINGVKIIESGILAAAHLSGAGNVKKILEKRW